MHEGEKRMKNILGIIFTLCSMNAGAVLIDRGDGLIYDSVLDVTWLQDGSYAQTSGYSSSELLTWYNATNWVDNLTFAGFSDWAKTRVREQLFLIFVVAIMAIKSTFTDIKYLKQWYEESPDLILLAFLSTLSNVATTVNPAFLTKKTIAVIWMT